MEEHIQHTENNTITWQQKSECESESERKKIVHNKLKIHIAKSKQKKCNTKWETKWNNEIEVWLSRPDCSRLLYTYAISSKQVGQMKLNKFNSYSDTTQWLHNKTRNEIKKKRNTQINKQLWLCTMKKGCERMRADWKKEHFL